MHLTSSNSRHATSKIHTAHGPLQDEFALAGDLRERERRRLQAVPAYTITSQDLIVHRESRSRSLDEVILEEIDQLGPGEWDRVVWQGGRVLAVVRVGGDGRKSVTRFDGQ